MGEDWEDEWQAAAAEVRLQTLHVGEVGRRKLGRAAPQF
jgi:hypothetical protein